MVSLLLLDWAAIIQLLTPASFFNLPNVHFDISGSRKPRTPLPILNPDRLSRSGLEDRRRQRLDDAEAAEARVRLVRGYLGLASNVVFTVAQLALLVGGLYVGGQAAPGLLHLPGNFTLP